jgi:dTDP-4-amino-4,6-dideoxygalactose transaminase
LKDGALGPLLERCEELGLSCRRPVGYLPDPVRAELDNLPGCREAWQTACSIPLYPALADEEVELVVSRFEAALGSVND